MKSGQAEHERSDDVDRRRAEVECLKLRTVTDQCVQGGAGESTTPPQSNAFQTMMNAAARMVIGREHIAPVLRDVLHWLPAPQRTVFLWAATASREVPASGRHRLRVTRSRRGQEDASERTAASLRAAQSARSTRCSRGQPATSRGEPATSAATPATSHGQPATSATKPATIRGQPATSVITPASVTRVAANASSRSRPTQRSESAASDASVSDRQPDRSTRRSVAV